MMRFAARPLSKLAKLWPLPVPTKMENGRLIYVDLRSGIGRHLLMTGKFDPVVFDPFRKALSDGSIFFDVGSNVGYYSMLSLDYVGAGGSVHAFEIDPRPLACLRKTIKRNEIPNLYLHEMAIGARKCKAILLRERDSALSSVHLRGRGKEVMMDTLDHFRNFHSNGRVSGIKIDVEGGELMVLQGAVRILREDRPVIVFEAEEEHVRKHGYALKEIFALLENIDYEYGWLENTWDSTVVAMPRH